MRVLVLDDDESRHRRFALNLIGHEVAHVYSYDELAEAVEEADEKFEVMYLDHDLCEDHYRGASSEDCGVEDGRDAARHIARLPPERRPNLVFVHSMNHSGAKEMVSILVEAGIFATRRIFHGSSGTEISY